MSRPDPASSASQSQGASQHLVAEQQVAQQPTQGVSLRPLQISDAAEMAQVLSHPDLYAFTGGEPPTVTDLERLYAIQTRGHSSDGSELWLNRIIVTGGRAVGYVQATIPCDGGPAEIAWVVGRNWHGKGYATGATQQLLDELRSLGVSDVVAHIHPDHVASQRVAERLGMAASDVVVDGEVRWTTGPGDSSR